MASANCDFFSGPGADEVAFELGDHAKHVRQQPADGVRRVVGAAADGQSDAFPGGVVGDVPGRKRASRLSFATTSVSPARHAARASRKLAGHG